MINPFNRFYDTELSVYEQSGSGYDSEGEMKLLGKVVCDIQPYEDDTESKMYSLSEKRSCKLFCDKNELIKNGRYIIFCGAKYMVVKTQNWDFGMSAVMRGTEDEY